jgi:hypothetical protein
MRRGKDQFLHILMKSENQKNAKENFDRRMCTYYQFRVSDHHTIQELCSEKFAQNVA